MEIIATYVFWLQILTFGLGTICVLWMFLYAAGQAADIVDGRRLVAFLAPYLVLPFCLILTFTLEKNGMYAAAVFSPFVLWIFVTIAGQLYLKFIPSFMADNYGPRPIPYPGFLVVPSENAPPGFQEVSHHYSKAQYSIHFRDERNDNCNLHILESYICKYCYSKSSLVKEFDYHGISGHVYASYDDKSKKTSLQLIWLNPPQQRVSIFLSYQNNREYSADDLIEILKTMKTAT